MLPKKGTVAKLSCHKQRSLINLYLRGVCILFYSLTGHCTNFENPRPILSGICIVIYISQVRMLKNKSVSRPEQLLRNDGFAPLRPDPTDEDDA